MTTKMPFLPASVMVWPLAPCVKLVPDCGRSSMPAGCPLLNSTVSRSYPGCVPVRSASMKATAGACADVMGAEAAHTNGGRLVSGVGEALGLGLGLGDSRALGVGLEPTTGPTAEGGRWSGLATTRTPITTAAITAAASPAIQ